MLRAAVVCMLLASGARADLTASAGDDWGAPRVALTVSSTERGEHLVFVLYESGRVLYRTQGEYFSVRLTPDEQRALFEQVPLAHVGALHPPSRDPSPGGMNAPREMLLIWKRLAHFVSARAEPWPLTVDLTVVAAPAACAPPVPWPANWPRKGARTTFTLSVSERDKWVAILTKETPPGCVRSLILDGKLYRPVFDRFFPHQDAWER